MTTPTDQAKPNSALPGVNVLLMGPSGTGKTHAIGTAVDYPDTEVFYFPFEQGQESLLGYWTDRGQAVPSNLHIVTVEAATAGWSEMADQVRMVNTLSYETLKKSVDANKAKYNQMEKFLRTFNDVTEDKTGKKFGAVDSWGTNKILVIDGLTGLGNAVMQAVIGGKADRDQKDWGLAQNILENFLRRLTSDTKCHVILIAHIERETDPVLGGTKLMVSSLGRALPPKLPAMFSDVILTVRNGAKWTWDTANPQADLKTRNLPVAADITPTFKTILDKWKSRGGVI